MKKTKQKKYNCADIEKKVQLFLDDRLPENEYTAFEDHLSYCLPCDKKVEFEKKFKELVRIKASEKSYPTKLSEELKKMLHDG